MEIKTEMNFWNTYAIGDTISTSEDVKWIRVDDIKKEINMLLTMVQLNVTKDNMNPGMYRDKVQEYRTIIYEKLLKLSKELEG